MTLGTTTVLVPFLLLFLALLLPVALAVNPSVEFPLGLVSGSVSSDGLIASFKGLPFAEAPVGALRFSAPVAKAPWQGVLSATEWTPGCFQVCVLPQVFCPTAQSEDCLTLNIFTPVAALSAAKPLPVMVFIPGGAFSQGTAGAPVYDGEALARGQGIVVVTINYRLGAFGFMAGLGTAPNRGLLDQRMALLFVQSYISYFGGDPTQVTLAGESAGAMSVAVHMTSPGSKGLFHRAVMQSNPWTMTYRDEEDAASSATESLLDATGCKDLACLGQMDAKALAVAADSVKTRPNLLSPHLDFFLAFAPVVDGDVVLDNSLDRFRTAGVVTVPYIIGTNRDEGAMFARIAFDSSPNSALYTAAVFALFGYQAAFVRYPSDSQSPDGGNLNVVADLLTDYVFQCPSRYAASLSTAQPAFVYRFDHVLSFGAPAYGDKYTYCNTRVCHGSELPFVFGTAQGLTSIAPTAAEIALQSVFMDLWGSFVRTGKPATGAFAWPQYTAASRRAIFLNAPWTPKVGDINADNCNFWDGKGYRV
jgi:carboxylesterase type B